MTGPLLRRVCSCPTDRDPCAECAAEAADVEGRCHACGGFGCNAVRSPAESRSFLRRLARALFGRAS